MADKEYIERGALISILDAKSEMAMGTPKAVFASASKMVELLPAADVVEVVRCCDCKHWGGVTFGYICHEWSGMTMKHYTKPTEFCCRGERKEQT